MVGFERRGVYDGFEVSGRNFLYSFLLECEFTKYDLSVMRPRIYYSSHHLWAANRWTSEAKRIEAGFDGTPRFDIEHRSFVTNAVFSAVAFLEAAINELFQDAYDEHLAYIGPLSPSVRESMGEFWRIIAEHNVVARSRFGTTEKYEMALALTHSDPLDRETDEYRNVRLVIQVQNALVHYKPSKLMQIDKSGFDESLQGKFPLNPMMAQTENPFFPDKALGAGCARWAIDACRNFTDTFFTEIGVKPNYQGAAFEVESEAGS